MSTDLNHNLSIIGKLQKHNRPKPIPMPEKVWHGMILYCLATHLCIYYWSYKVTSITKSLYMFLLFIPLSITFLHVATLF